MHLSFTTWHTIKSPHPSPANDTLMLILPEVFWTRILLFDTEKGSLDRRCSVSSLYFLILT